MGRLAWRLVWGRPRRAWLAIASVAVGTAVVLVVLAALAGFGQYLFDRATGTLLGDGVVTAAASVAERRASDVFDPAPVVAALGARPDVPAPAAPRLIVPVLVGKGDSERAAFLHGVEPSAEAALSRDVTGLAALAATSAAAPAVLLSAVQAEALHAATGDEVELTATDRFGLPRGARARVAGIYASASRDVEAFVVLGGLDLAGELLDARGLAHEVGFAVPAAERALDRIPAAVGKLAATLPTSAGTTLHAEPWSAVSPEIVDYVNVNVAVYRVFLLVEVLLVGLAVADILWLGLEERLRDVGTIGALGAAPRTLAGLVLVQAAWLLGIGIALGLAAGRAIVLYLERAGIPGLDASAAFSVGGFSIGAGVSGRFEPGQLGFAVTTVLTAGMLAALIPAWRAWRLEPVEALRHR